VQITANTKQNKTRFSRAQFKVRMRVKYKKSLILDNLDILNPINNVESSSGFVHWIIESTKDK
jgi:hypothetical protein